MVVDQAGEKKHQQGPVTDLERKFAALNPGFSPRGVAAVVKPVPPTPALQIHHSKM
jgi:hypothetical protein